MKDKLDLFVDWLRGLLGVQDDVVDIVVTVVLIGALAQLVAAIAKVFSVKIKA